MPAVFLSYSHQDEAWKKRLQTHLGALEIATWDDRRIEGGEDWLKKIKEAMAHARIAILLVSADFLASEFIRHEEVPRILDQRQQEGMIVFPVIVRSCAWEEIDWLRKMQARPLDGQPLARFRGDRRDSEMANIAREIQRALLIEERVRGTKLLDQDDFISRVETTCRHREPGATIERCPALGSAGPYLRVTRSEGDTYPVGAIEHGVSGEILQAFLDQIDQLYRRNDRGVISVLVYGGERAPEHLLREAGEKRVHLVSFVEYQGLLDFRSYISRQTARLAVDPLYSLGYVPQRLRVISPLSHEEDESGDALTQVQEWLASPYGRFVVILGDPGVGKTFLLHKLAHYMGEAKGGLVPILLQIHSLEKSRSLDVLLAQHFAQQGMESFSPLKFRHMLEQGRIVLLFDGFDELVLRVTYPHAMDHFTSLLQAANGNSKVVFTSLKQHFLPESLGKTTLDSIPGHRIAILQPLPARRSKKVNRV